MLNQYPLWKNLLVAIVLLAGLLFTLPNIYSQDPVIEVTGTRGEEVGQTLQNDVLAALQPQYREALLLRYHMGLGVSEVAQAVGRSYKATESLLSRARKQFETDLRDAGFHL